MSSLPPETINVNSVGNVSELVTVSENSVGRLPRLEPEKEALLGLAYAVGSIIGLISLIILVRWLTGSPWLGAPVGLAEMTPEHAKTVLETIKGLDELETERATKLFQVIISGAFLPVFTAIVGYIVGSKVEQKSS